MKILGIEIGSPAPLPQPSPRLLDQPRPSLFVPPVCVPFDETPLGVLTKKVDAIEDLLKRNTALAEKWERHLEQSQDEKYKYVVLYETAKRELEAAQRINAFREAQIASLRTRIAALEEPKLPRMVSHKPAPLPAAKS